MFGFGAFGWFSVKLKFFKFVFDVWKCMLGDCWFLRCCFWFDLGFEWFDLLVGLVWLAFAVASYCDC